MAVPKKTAIRKDLTLKEKFELIQQSKSLKATELAALYGCGKMQVYSVLKNKAKVIVLYESSLEKNMSLDSQAEKVTKW